MRILFLDDNGERHAHFKAMLAFNTDVDHVWTAQECMDALKNNPTYDLVCLDHDLGGRQMVTEKAGSGSEVAEFIRNDLARDHYPKNVIIHSWNPAGADYMFGQIAFVGIPVKRIPFAV